MKHQFKFTVIVVAEHQGRSLKALAKEARVWLPRVGDGRGGALHSTKGYYSVIVKKVKLQSTVKLQ